MRYEPLISHLLYLISKTMRLAFLGILLFFTVALSAQLRMTSYFDRDTILVGDSVHLTYEVELPPNARITKVDVSNWSEATSLEELLISQMDSTLNGKEIIQAASQVEILNYGRWTAAEGATILQQNQLGWERKKLGGNTLFSNTITLTFWDAGNYFIPPLTYYYLVNGKETSYTKPYDLANVQTWREGTISVVAPALEDLSEVDTTTNLTPIKPIFEEQLNWKDFWLLYVSLAVLGLIALVWWLIWRSKSKEVVIEKEVVVIPPHEMALQKLNDLKIKELWQKGEDKEYQSELTYIIREYLEKSLPISRFRKHNWRDFKPFAKRKYRT